MTQHQNINANLPALSSRLAKVASALSGNSGINIVFSGNECCTDMMGNIRLPVALAVAMAEGDEEATRLMFGKVAHEKGHDAVQKVTEFLSKQRKKAVLTASLQSAIVDILTDASIDLANYQDKALTKHNGALTVTSLLKRLPSKTHRMWFNAIEDIRMERGLTLDGERIFTAHNRNVAAAKWEERIKAGKQAHPMLATSVAMIFQAHNISIDFMPIQVIQAVQALSPFSALIGTDAADDSQVNTVWDAYNLTLAIVEYINESGAADDTLGQGQGDEAQSDDGQEDQDQDGNAESNQDGEGQGEGDDSDDSDGDSDGEGSESSESSEDGAEGDEEGEGQGEGQGDSDDDESGQGEGGDEDSDEDSEGEGDQDGHNALSDIEEGEGQGTVDHANAATGDNDQSHIEAINVDNVNPFKVLRNPSDWMLTEEPLEDAIDEAITEAGSAVYNDLTPEGLAEVEDAWTVTKEAAENDRLTVLEADDWDICRYNRNAKAIGGTATTIAGQLRALLTSRSLARRQGDQDSGRLDRRALHRLNRPGMLPAKNVFERTIKGQSHNVAIMIMLDCSGSMYGKKLNTARKALHIMGNALTGLETLGVKWASYGFTTLRTKSTMRTGYNASRGEALQHYQFKSFDDNWRRSDIAARTYSDLATSCNCDSDSIRWGLNELLKQKADRHILLVLSDGQPAFIGASSGTTALKATIEGARKVGVEVGSIGIMTNDPKAYYGDDTPVIHDIDQLPKALLDQARNWFIK